MIRNFCITSILILFFSGSVQAQELDSLSKDSETFFQQISTILMNTPSKRMQEEAEVLLPRFYARWSIGRFNKMEKDEVRRLIESMRARGMRTYPHLFDYIYSLTLLSESHQGPKSIIAWHAYAIKLLDHKKTTPFSDFMAFTHELFEKDQLFKKKSLFWYHRNAKFSFMLDTNFMLNYERLNLVCATKKDSSTILKTSGVFNYNSQIWSGNEGVVKWSRFGEEMGEEIYANFPYYEINLNHANYVVDSAVLHHSRFFGKPVLGQFSEMVKSSPANSKTSYPRFDVYGSDFVLEKVYPDIDFHGGFNLKGLLLYGIGDEFIQPQLLVHHQDTVFARIEAALFLLGDDKLEASDASTTFYFDQDSLYHPKLRFRYVNSDRQLVLFSDDNRSDLIPFFDTYHQLDIYVQSLFWNLEENEMYFRRIRNTNSENTAYFVSSNYYSAKDFYKIQGIDEINPLDVVQNYMEAYGQTEITLNSLAAFMDKPPEQVSAMLIGLSNKGFLVYNSIDHVAVVKDRLSYFLDAKGGRTDYDVIRLESNVVAKPNASIDLKDLSLNVYGVPEVIISDSQEVYIYPYDKSISFKKNRDFAFEGQVHMGYLDFYTRNSTFVYDSFMLNMNYVDSLAFTLLVYDSIRMSDSLVNVHNVITDLNGKIYIDQPFNKSGLKQFPEYPSFVSHDDSYVYFNRKSIQDSTLLADSFYFKVDPFVFDSISTFTTEGLSFDGELVSNIFPTLRQPLEVMPDYSLGFFHVTPEEGYDVYGGKAKFNSKVSISNEGFLGDGMLAYLTATVASNDFIFYPDSLIASCNDFYLDESPDVYDFPSIQGDTVDIMWLVDTNVMRVKHHENPFIVYANSILKGDLYASPEFLKGDGAFHFDRSEIISRDIRFKYSQLTADSADFYLRDETGSEVVFKSLGYYAKVDFDQQKAWFNHLYDQSFVEFPFNKYISTLKEVEWLMNEDKLILDSDLANSFAALDTMSDSDLIDYKLQGPYEFVSIKDDQDSLRFYAGGAIYNLTQYTIDVSDVRIIKVADAAIFPEGNALKIQRDAGITTLLNARMITDTTNKYHYIYDAEVDIFGRHQYMAKGYIDYTDRNDARQPIYLNSITVSNMGSSIGFGEVSKDDLFFLSPEYFYSGQVGMSAGKEHLRFSGGYKINENCTNYFDNWVKFDKYLDPMDIFFSITDSTKNLENKNAKFGLAFSRESQSFYPLLLQAPKASDDFLLVDAIGRVDFDVDGNKYRVGSSERLLKKNMEADYVELSNERCVMQGDGQLNMGLNFSMITLDAVGSFRHLIIPDSTYLKTSLLLDFHFDPKAVSMMVDSLRLAQLPNVNTTKSSFPLFLKKKLGNDRGAKIMNEVSLYGQIKKMPPELNHTILFTDLNLKWDRESRSFISQGPIGIGYIGGSPVNKYVSGYVQIENSRTGSGFHCYLRVSDSRWYFFSYKNGIMQMISSDNAFNDYITELKPEKRILNTSSDENYYEFLISTRRKSTDFIRKMDRAMKY